MEQWAYLVGLVLGSLLILSVIFLTVKNRKVGMGEAFLVVMGVFLVGLTLWANVKISLSLDGLLAEFNQVKEQVETLSVANLTLNEQVETIAVAAEKEREQVIELTHVLQDQGVANPERLEMIRGEISSVPVVDRSLLRNSRDLVRRPPQ